MPKKTIDLMAPLRKSGGGARRTARKSGADVGIEVRGSLEIVLDDEALAMNLAQHLSDAVRGDIDANQFPVDEETRARRARKPVADRYPGGYYADPSGPYGTDSGYLRDNIKASLDSGKSAFVGIPKIRQKAAFILRLISKTVKNMSGARARKAVDLSLIDALTMSIKGTKR